MRKSLTPILAVISRCSTQACAVVLMLFAARYLSPADFGIYALAAMLVTLARTLLYAGPYEFLLKTDDEVRWSLAALTINIGLSLASLLVLALLSPVWSILFGASNLAMLLTVSAGSLPFCALAAWQEAKTIRAGHVTGYYLTLGGAQFASLGISIALLTAGWGVYALVAQLYTAPIIQLAAYFLLRSDVRPARPHLSDMREILVWSSHRYGSTVLNFGSQYGGDLLLGLFLGPAATGIYRAANRIVSGVADIFAQPTRMLATIALSKMRARGDSLDARWLKMLGATGVFTVPCLIGLAIYADIATPLALGADWAAASTAVAILSIARALTISNQIAIPALVAYDKGKTLLRNQASLTILQITVTCLAAPFGVTAVVIGTMLQSLFASFIYLRSVIQISSRPLELAPPIVIVGIATIVVAAVAAIARLALYEFAVGSWTSLLLGMAACAVAWILVVARTRRQVLNYIHVLASPS